MNRRAFLGFATVLGLAGCSAVPQPMDGPSGDDRAPLPQPSPEAFPVTLQHVYGETTIPARPQRVACVGLASHDVCVELGVVPVSVTVFESMRGKLTPWFDDRFMEIGGRFPEMFNASRGVRVDDVAKGAPDLILAVNAGLTQQQYEQLSGLAPVVAHPGDPWATDWRTTAEMVSTALGMPEQAERMASGALDVVAEMQQIYAPYAGTTAMYAGATTVPGADLTFFGSETNQVRAIELFGLDLAPGAAAFEQAEALDPVLSEPFAAERLSAIDADVVVAQLPRTEWRQALDRSLVAELLGRDPESTITLSEGADAFALLESSPLSLSWAARSVIPQIAKSRFLTASE